jgi:hypothetical protein
VGLHDVTQTTRFQPSRRVQIVFSEEIEVGQLLRRHLSLFSFVKVLNLHALLLHLCPAQNHRVRAAETLSSLQNNKHST